MSQPSSNKGKQKASPGGNRRNIQVSGLVRLAQAQVQDGFRTLPPWAQAELACTLVTLFPLAFNKTLEGKERQETGGEAKATPPVPANPKQAAKSSVTKSTPVVEASGSTEVRPPAKTPKLKGWNRPEVEKLECARQLRSATAAQRQSREMKEPQQLFSAALGAAARGAKVGASPKIISESLTACKQSVSSFARLWPSVRSRKLWAALAAHKYGVDKVDVMSVEDKYIIYTPLVPTWTIEATEELDEDEYFYLNRALPLDNIPWHRAGVGEPPPADGPLVKKFLDREYGDYRNLGSFVHTLKGKVQLYWVNFGLTNLKWGDDDSEIEIKASPSPKVKKRKANYAVSDD
jgi:hypothetical protein